MKHSKKVDPKFEKMAEKASVWVISDEGLAAMDRAVKDAHEVVEKIKEAQRIGRAYI